jgi:plasmid maintenance system antidote protein VapI
MSSRYSELEKFSTPAELLNWWMHLGQGQRPYQAAILCNMPRSMFVGILEGRWPITEKIARCLGHGTGIPQYIWLNLEMKYQDALWRERQADA